VNEPYSLWQSELAREANKNRASSQSLITISISNYVRITYKALCSIVMLFLLDIKLIDSKSYNNFLRQNIA
jgi:hypothetical protein